MITKYLLMLLLISQMTDNTSSDLRILPEEDRFFTNIQRIVPEGRFHNGSISSDGKLVCYQGDFVAGGVGDQIWIKPTYGGEPKMLSIGVFPTSDPVFIPNQDSIIFSSTEEVNLDPAFNLKKRFITEWFLGTHDLYRVNVGGTELIRLTENTVYDGEAAVSNDGKTIAFTSFRDNNVDIYSMSMHKLIPKRLTTSPGIDCQPCFTPDGMWIIFVGTESEKGADSVQPETILPETGLTETMQGQQLVSEMEFELHIMSIDGSDRRTLTKLGACSINPTVHPNGEYVIFESNYEPDGNSKYKNKLDYNLFKIAIDGTRLQQITFNSGYDGNPSFAQDGIKLVWTSMRSLASEKNIGVYMADWMDAEFQPSSSGGH
ncbi:PD40 domain-containing protein [bacterium]|nr:PD40 domain-containing protein [bacterium]